MLPSPKLWLLGAVLMGGLTLGTLGGWSVQGWRKDIQIEEIKRVNAEQKAVDATNALTQLETMLVKMGTSAQEAQADVGVLNAKLDMIRKELKNVKPLPADCRPDAPRVQNLRAAVKAANSATAGRKPSPTVP